MTVGKKFSLACAVLVGLTALLGGVSIYGVRGIEENLHARRPSAFRKDQAGI
jgi:hypothetical protein